MNYVYTILQDVKEGIISKKKCNRDYLVKC